MADLIWNAMEVITDHCKPKKPADQIQVQYIGARVGLKPFTHQHLRCLNGPTGGTFPQERLKKNIGV